MRHSITQIFIRGVVAMAMLAGCVIAMGALPTNANASSAPVAKIDQPGCVPTLTALEPVSLRRGPGLRWPRLAWLSINAQAQITGRLANNSWFQVMFQGRPGWVFWQRTAVACIGQVPVVSPMPVPQIETGDFRANPVAVTPGQCSTLSWNVSNVASVYFVEAGKNIGVAGNATKVVCPKATTQYSLLVTRRDNTSFNSVVVVSVVALAATAVPVAIDPANFHANPTTIAVGQCSTLSWNVDNVSAVYFKENGNTTGVPGNSSKLVCPQQTTQYSLVVQRRDGTSFNSVVMVTVTAAASQPTFRADNATINPGQCTTLRWAVDNVAAVFLVTGSAVQGVPGNATQQVCPSTTTTYILRVQRRDNTTFDTPLTVGVNGANQPNFRADNTSIAAGQCTTLRWEIDNVRGVWFWDPGTRTAAAGRDARQVCPANTTTYRLEVQRNDGTTGDYFAAVMINGSAPAIPPTPQP